MVSFIVNEDTLDSNEKQLFYYLKNNVTYLDAENILIPLINHTGPVSLRVLDWTVVNWSKSHNATCTTLDGKVVYIHDAYAQYLAKWKRKLFDPFRRRSRISIKMNDDTYETTLGQVNFVYWAYRTGVYVHVMKNLHLIEKHMNAVLKECRRKRFQAKKTGEKMKRRPLTKPSCVMSIAQRVPLTIHLSSKGSISSSTV